MYYLIAFIAVFAIIIFVHEFGHFLAARKSGMAVEEFGFGFPPRLWGIKRGKTLYSINLIPLGGFVKIKGENGEESGEQDAFASKGIFRRAITLLAGVTANVLLAYVIFTAGYAIGTPQIVEDLPTDAVVANSETAILGVLPGSPADAAGLKANDVVFSINGISVSNADMLREAIKDSSGQIELGVRRGEEEQTIKADPRVLSETGSRGLGVNLAQIGTVRFPWYKAPYYGGVAVVSVLAAIGSSFWGLLSGIFLGHGVSADVTGPVGIAAATGQAASLGFAYLAQFTAILSLNLAVLNIIPFPALDGGRLLFLIIEGLRRRPVSRKVEGIVHQTGFALLMLLILVITWNDLVRYGGAIGGFVRRLF